MKANLKTCNRRWWYKYATQLLLLLLKSNILRKLFMEWCNTSALLFLHTKFCSIVICIFSTFCFLLSEFQVIFWLLFDKVYLKNVCDCAGSLCCSVLCIYRSYYGNLCVVVVAEWSFAVYFAPFSGSECMNGTWEVDWIHQNFMGCI